MTFYFASQYSNLNTLLLIKDRFEKAGHVVTSRWLDGQHTGRSDEDLQRYALEDLTDIDIAACFVLFEIPYGDAPPSTGRAVEFGYAYRTHKQIFIVGQRCSMFHFLPHITHYEFVNDFIEAFI